MKVERPFVGFKQSGYSSQTEDGILTSISTWVYLQNTGCKSWKSAYYPGKHRGSAFHKHCCLCVLPHRMQGPGGSSLNWHQPRTRTFRQSPSRSHTSTAEDWNHRNRSLCYKQQGAADKEIYAKWSRIWSLVNPRSQMW